MSPPLSFLQLVVVEDKKEREGERMDGGMDVREEEEKGRSPSGSASARWLLHVLVKLMECNRECQGCYFAHWQHRDGEKKESGEKSELEEEREAVMCT